MMLHENEDLQVFYQPGKARYLVVTFGPLAMLADGRTLWAGEPLQKLDVPLLCFMAKAPHWYPEASLRPALESCRAVLAAHACRIGYGFSMGAHGAIRHARALGLDSVVACAPQWTIDPARLGPGIPNLHGKYHRPDRHEGMELVDFPEAARLYLLYDPHRPADDWHAAQVAQHIAPTRRVRMPFLGHGTVRAFTSTTLLAMLMEAARARDDELVQRVARHARRANPARELLLARRNLPARYERGLALMRRGAAKAPPARQSEGWLDFARQAVLLDRAAEARELAEAALAVSKGRGAVAEEARRLLARLDGPASP
ncbi:hypothetical protein NON00_07035 [Roseomonas sp. GC11]|uniref:hypothetical protein n=1 Tax=Roseomonas sp. GC11 TaxID=2950546 RepID=UPI00210C0150|nr:hypothetical protein [Roseomonas sp. GC11]MCQ4159678.1 hypothetical protein [Roseomonas sp. GC11]